MYHIHGSLKEILVSHGVDETEVRRESGPRRGEGHFYDDIKC